MGTRINMTDGYSSPVSRMTSQTQQFAAAARQGDRAVDGLGHSAMASTAGVGAFTAGSRAATMSIRGLVGGIATLSASLLGLSSVMTAIMGLLTFKLAYDWLVASNAEMEQYYNTLTVVLKSSEKATETLKWAAKFAADTPFEIPQIVEATTRLASYGITAQKTLGTIGDMASVMGKPLMQAVEAIADAQTGELERMKEFGITKDMIASQASKMGTDVINSKGQITDLQAFNAALFSIMEDRFKDGMKMQSKTFRGMMSNAKDFIGTMGREFGKPIFERMETGLANTLSFLDRIKENGSMAILTAKVQTAGNAVADVFSFAFGIAGRVITVVNTKVTEFLDANAPRFQFFGELMGSAFTTFSKRAMPVLDWFIDIALPRMLDMLAMAGSWVLRVAQFFTQNWRDISPFIMGIGIALGVILGPGYAFLGILYLVTQATKAWAIAQGILNVVMSANPVYLLIAGIGLLVGAAIWVVQNWETVKTFFAGLFSGILQGVVTAMTFVGVAAKSVLTEVARFFADLIPQAVQWGSGLIRAFVDGVKGAKNYLVDNVKDAFSAVRKLMPSSDAQEGPFSELTFNGGKILTTMAEGVRSQTPVLRSALSDAFRGVPTTPTVNRANSIQPVSPAGSQPVSSRTIVIQKLLDKLEISGDNKNPEELANEVLRIITERLQAADEVYSPGMGGLLDGI